MTTETTTDTETPAEPVEAVPRDGRWALIQLMGHKTIAGRVTPDELLGGGVVLVQTPGPDGVTLRREQSSNPQGPALYLANWCTRQEVLDYLYPPVRTQLALTAPDEYDPDLDDDDEEYEPPSTRPAF